MESSTKPFGYFYDMGQGTYLGSEDPVSIAVIAMEEGKKTFPLYKEDRQLQDLQSVSTSKKSFEQAWAEMQKLGYQYGEDALMNVRFGWEIAQRNIQPALWPNASNVTVPAALRYLARHERPTGGESRFNAIHLEVLADEIERMAQQRLYVSKGD